MRKGGGFFYGKSSNENHIEGVRSQVNRSGCKADHRDDQEYRSKGFRSCSNAYKVEKITILRAVHKYKDSREQFEQRTHKRLIDVLTPSQKTIDALQKLDVSAGVYVNVKMK